MTRSHHIHSLVRLLYSHNPFYVLSAALILYGLRIAFAEGDAMPARALALATSIACYTLVMAFTAILVIRVGKVWQDARSILLIVALMFVTLSISFDDLCNFYPAVARLLLPAGLAFSVMVTEVVLRAIRLRLPLEYRLPFYAILTTFFLYPLWVSPIESRSVEIAAMWKIFLFPTVCGATFLTLIPAIRRGSRRVANNGTPWSWPLYPWTLFALLGGAVCFRSYLLTLSFQSGLEMETSFGLYYLVPFFFVALLLLLEIGWAERRKGLQLVALSAAPLLIWCSIPEETGVVFTSFLGELIASAGSPIWLCVMALLVFYGYARHRGLPEAEVGIYVALAAATVVGRGTVDLQTLVAPQWWPWALATAIQFERLLSQLSSGRCFAALCCVSLTAISALGDAIPVQYSFVLVAHAILIGSLAISIAFDDRFARLLRGVSSVLLMLFAAAAWPTAIRLELTDAVWMPYLWCLAAVSLTWLLILRQRWWAVVTLVNTSAAAAALTHWGYTRIDDVVPRSALLPLLWGAICFAIAVAISAMKAGVLDVLRDRLSVFTRSMRADE